MTNKNQLDLYIKENQTIVNRTYIGCGCDERDFETKYLVEKINYENSKVKLLPIAKRTVILWGSECNEEFKPLEEKSFWAKITLDDEHLFLYNGNRDFGYYKAATK